MENMQPIVELDDVTVAYQYQTVLESVSLQVLPGSFLAIVGPNGAGKTTLLKTILGVTRPVAGTVRVFGKPPWAMGEERHRIGYVPQVSLADLGFPILVSDAVLMGRYGRIGLFRRPSAADREAALRAMERVGVADLAERPIAHLSGGQRQRVFLARALANDPVLLLLDEPTAGVDIAATESFYDLLYRLHNEGMTTLFVSHDVSVVAKYANGVACINRQMVVHGRPEEIEAGAVLACMYGPQAIFLDHGPIPHLVVSQHPESDASGAGKSG
jgi:ABC-type Mn2+/Zn2+ transport system ATPase subunit